ncbi:hypothetical protein SERLADRAFT_435202 [Serpula lacrymans var. lacrymans S7.9]|uniref:Uncharacterized protein n=1 Tax=Serpula lacrymans var. lacrymans (strain S7.9) TaxID=578457 RepID=F8NMM9_SERL9|nr:uncharacterized protein SERLADRAFT_435202 [Serpula lacrymans var. lacrymans S7.9]EGO27426.1 hypothetical protein SERLADRAFT_435202 [Serpula lacrymans var. lacrymans S7.9]
MLVHIPAGLEDARSARLLSVQQCLTIGEIVVLVPMPYTNATHEFLELVFSSHEKELAADVAHKKLQALRDAGNFPSSLAEVKVQNKWSLKADTNVAMGEVTASGSKSVESLIDRKKNKVDFVKRAAKRRRELTDRSEGASRSNEPPPPAKKGKKGGEPYKGKINRVKKDGKGKGKAPQK